MNPVPYPCGNQTPQDRYMRDIAPGWSLYQGGLGCVAGETLIDLADGTRERIHALAKRGQPVCVITTHGPVWCPPPVRGGTAELFKVEAGALTITVTGRHRFFSEGSWLRCSELRPGKSVLVHPPSSPGLSPQVSPQDAPRSIRKGGDSPGDCLPESHLCGPRPQSAEGDGLAFAPSLDDARAHSRQSSRPGAHPPSPAHSQSGQQSGHRAMPGCEGPYGFADLALAECGEESAESPRPLCRLAPQCRQSVAPAHAARESLPRASSMEQREFSDLPDRQPWDAPLVDESIGAYSVITRITPVGIADFYDVNVPGRGHYLAHGFWNHNSGKTWASARKFLWLHAYNGCPSLAVAPTYGDLWRFVVPALAACAQAWRWPYELVRNIVPQFKIAGQPIFLISGEHPERFAGFEVGAVWVDEGARIQSDTSDPLRDAPTQIRTRLRHPDAKALHGMVSTTPEGCDTWIQRDWFDKPLPDHRYYIGKTRDNRALRPEYLAAQMASLPAELIEQYLDGNAVSYVAHRAHPTFARARHVVAVALDPKLPTHIGADYNVSPMCWLLAQVVGDVIHFLDEVVLPDFGQVDAAVHAAHAKGWGGDMIDGQLRPRHTTLHPDKSAKARSTVGDPEFVAMTKTARALGWNFSGSAGGVNPPVQGRINHLSRLLQNGTGQSRIKIHPRCVTLIADLERTARGSSGYDPGSDGKRGHILDAAGYLAWDVIPPTGSAAAVPATLFSL